MHLLRALLGTALVATSAAAAPDSRPSDLSLSTLDTSGATAVAETGSGERVELALDLALQRAADRLLRVARPMAGAVVAVDTRTGDVLALVERGFAVQDTAPAASVFKIVTTAALLERGGVSPTEEVCTSGGTFGIERRHMDPPSGGDVTCGPFAQALGHSRNAVYAQLATTRLGRADLIEVAERLGFNRPSASDITAPMGTLSVPVEDLSFARAAAGFAGSELSPLGAAQLALTIARGGVPVEMFVALRQDRTPEILPRVLDAEVARQLTRMMEVTVSSGTSRDTFLTRSGRPHLGAMSVAGKTGTLKLGSDAPTTTWFIGFAPARNPRIALSVLVQNGPVWHRKANDVARDVLRAYFAARGYRGVTDPFAPSD